jgi:hypothetical protein
MYSLLNFVDNIYGLCRKGYMVTLVTVTYVTWHFVLPYYQFSTALVANFSTTGPGPSVLYN